MESSWSCYELYQIKIDSNAEYTSDTEAVQVQMKKQMW
jgi:hypothetical protein